MNRSVRWDLAKLPSPNYRPHHHFVALIKDLSPVLSDTDLQARCVAAFGLISGHEIHVARVPNAPSHVTGAKACTDRVGTHMMERRQAHRHNHRNRSRNGQSCKPYLDRDYRDRTLLRPYAGRPPPPTDIAD